MQSYIPHHLADKRKLSLRQAVALVCGFLLWASILAFGSSHQSNAQEPVVVQPGAPGQPTKRLPPTTTAKLPPLSQAEVEFMQGMIMHHAQAVEMTALIPSHSENKDLKTLGARISRSQQSEIKFMKRWLAVRGEPLTMPMAGMEGMGMPHHAAMLMPGMLTPEQMEALRKAKGDEFDRLFLTGMIQHHNGALTMVKELFAKPGAGQNAEVFDFATDVDTGQRAEIRIMQSMLEKLQSCYSSDFKALRSKTGSCAPAFGRVVLAYNGPFLPRL
jgi:uncharacterized protein (DUF305 family)